MVTIIGINLSPYMGRNIVVSELRKVMTIYGYMISKIRKLQ